MAKKDVNNDKAPGDPAAILWKRLQPTKWTAGLLSWNPCSRKRGMKP